MYQSSLLANKLLETRYSLTLTLYIRLEKRKVEKLKKKTKHQKGARETLQKFR